MIPQRPAAQQLQQVFGEEQAPPAQQLPRCGPPVTHRICHVITETGQEWHYSGCDHERTDDELGEIKPPGWTVQH